MAGITPLDLQQADTRRLVELAGLLSDDLTATPLERELVRRFEEMLDDEEDGDKAIVEAARDFNLSADEIRQLADATIKSANNTIKLLEALSAEDIEFPYQLKAELELANRIRQIVKNNEMTGLTQLLKDLAEE